ncbi:MAG: hypothetical protein ACRDYX_06910 [Egibacteraceae bacterium]
MAGAHADLLGIGPEEPHGRAQVGLDAPGGCAGAGAVFGSAPQAAQRPPGGVGLDEVRSGGGADRSEQVGDPPFGAGDVLVTLGQRLVGGQHGAQVVRGSRLRVGVERLVGDRQPPRRDVGEDGRARAPAQPAQRRAGHREGRQRGGNHSTVAAQQLTDASGEREAGAPAALVELVLDTAVAADVARGHAGAVGAVGAVGAHGRVGTGRMGKPAGLPAACAPAAPAQCRGVAGLADRPFRPPGGRWPLGPAVRAGRQAPGRAGGADRRRGAGVPANPHGRPRPQREHVACGMRTQPRTRPGPRRWRAERSRARDRMLAGSHKLVSALSVRALSKGSGRRGHTRAFSPTRGSATFVSG